MAYSLTTRWGLYRLWLRKTYRFNWAHKPLCARYREDVLKIGSLYLCRSCLFVYLGVAVALGYSTLRSSRDGATEILPLTVLLAGVLLCSAPPWYKRLPRGIRDGLRFLLGASLVFIADQGLRGEVVFFVLSALACYGAWRLYATARQRRKRSNCASCPEYSPDRVCPGYRLQTTKIKEYQEEATEYLLARGYRPTIIRAGSR